MSQTIQNVKNIMKTCHNIPSYIQLNKILTEQAFDDYEFDESMQISDIGLAMFKPKLTFGSRYSIFMTQQAFVFVDALVCREGGAIIAQV